MGLVYDMKLKIVLEEKSLKLHMLVLLYKQIKSRKIIKNLLQIVE
jgi:hypothetical protein